MSSEAVALLAVAAAIIILAAAVLLAAWWHLGRQWPDTLNDHEVAANGRPVVGSKLILFAADDADPPTEDRAP